MKVVAVPVWADSAVQACSPPPSIVKVPRFCAWIGLRLVSNRARLADQLGCLDLTESHKETKPTPVRAANTSHKASDLCSAATLGMRMPCLVSEWSRTSALLRVACN